MTISADNHTAIPGVPETALAAEALSELPPDAPPAPWTAHASAICWWQRPHERATDALRAALPAAIIEGATPLLTVGALLAYTDTPVGPYNEALGLVVLRRGPRVFTHVPFIAVDSPASVVGGRVNWALPKALATFDGLPASGAMSASGSDWTIRTTARALGPPLPWILPALGLLEQVGPDGHVVAARPSGRGTARLARIDVEIPAAPTLTDWFPVGRFLGIVSHRLTGHLPPRGDRASASLPVLA